MIEIVHGDARQVEPPADIGCLVFDPPWDDAELACCEEVKRRIVGPLFAEVSA